MSLAQQSAITDRKTQQAMRRVADVKAEWIPVAPVPRSNSATRGALRVPFDGPQVGFESSLERDFLVCCRNEPRIRSVRAQQLQIHYFDRGRGKRRRYTPDFVVDLHEDAGLGWTRAIVEVKRSKDLWRSRQVKVAAYAAAKVWAATEGNAIFRVVTDGEMAPAWLANARLLSPFLDRPFDAELLEHVERILQASGPRRLGELVGFARERSINSNGVLPVLYRMMALGELQFDRGQPITTRTWITPRGSPK